MITDIDVTAAPDAVRFVTDEGTHGATGKAPWTHADATVTSRETPEGTAFVLEAATTPVRFVQLRWHGGFEETTRFLGDAFERSYGNLEWRGFVPDRVMAWYVLASDGTGTTGFGVKVRPGAVAWWTTDHQGVSLWLDVRCGSRGVVLDGKALHMATLVTATSTPGESPFDFMSRFCGLLCTDPLLPAAPVYGANNWYYAFGNSSHQQVLADADLLAEVSAGLDNRPYLVIDDCWQPLALSQSAAGRPNDTGNIRFPDMPGLAAAIRARGLRPGIWIRPLETSERDFVTDPALRSARTRRALDITNPAALDLIAADVARLVTWGYELIKFDFMTCDALGVWGFDNRNIVRMSEDWAWQDRSTTNAQAITGVYRVIRDSAAGAVLLGCNTVGHLGAGLMHLSRIGDDISDRRFDRTMLMGVNALAFRLAQHNRFFAVDADCAPVTGAAAEMNRQFLALLARSGTPLFYSADPAAADDSLRALLRAALAPGAVQDAVARPLDWLDNSIPARWEVDGEEITFAWLAGHGMDDIAPLPYRLLKR